MWPMVGPSRWWNGFREGRPPMRAPAVVTPREVRADRGGGARLCVSSLATAVGANLATAVGAKSAMDRPRVSRYRASRGFMHKWSILHDFPRVGLGYWCRWLHRRSPGRASAHSLRFWSDSR